MAKKLFTMLVFAALLLPIGCKYDDTDLWNSVNNLDDRVGKLEVAVQKLNDNVQVLSDLMNGKLFIQSIEDQGQRSACNTLYKPCRRGIDHGNPQRQGWCRR